MTYLIPPYLIPQWPAPPHIKAFCTTRQGGISKPPYDSFNLAMHVGDNPLQVIANREKLSTDLQLRSHPLWLKQIHGSAVIPSNHWQEDIEADGCYATDPNHICAVMTADCLPLLVCNTSGTEVMALHGGWRSLAAGIIHQGLKCFQASPKDILVWLGPAIGSSMFEVGYEVREQFLALSLALEDCFKPSPNKRWLMDIYNIAKIQLNQLGIDKIYGGNYCTHTDYEYFFSYRREGATGRMASLIYRL